MLIVADADMVQEIYIKQFSNFSARRVSLFENGCAVFLPDTMCAIWLLKRNFNTRLETTIRGQACFLRQKAAGDVNGTS